MRFLSLLKVFLTLIFGSYDFNRCSNVFLVEFKNSFCFFYAVF